MMLYASELHVNAQGDCMHGDVGMTGTFPVMAPNPACIGLLHPAMMHLLLLF